LPFGDILAVMSLKLRPIVSIAVSPGLAPVLGRELILPARVASSGADR
jgi:hypothetical protein